MENYTTKNLFVASYLLASGRLSFEGLETLDFKTKLFVFTPYVKAKELEKEYFSGGKLPVKTVFAEYNSLKDMLFERDTNGENNYGATYK